MHCRIDLEAGVFSAKSHGRSIELPAEIGRVGVILTCRLRAGFSAGQNRDQHPVFWSEKHTTCEILQTIANLWSSSRCLFITIVELVVIISTLNTNWLVVLTILKNISQWKGLSHILWKINAIFETTNQLNVQKNKTWTFNKPFICGWSRAIPPKDLDVLMVQIVTKGWPRITSNSQMDPDSNFRKLVTKQSYHVV